MSKQADANVIIIANDLKSGCSVFLTENGRWSLSRFDAATISSELVDLRIAMAKEDEKNNLILDPYPIELNDAGEPAHIREYIRAYGPSIGHASGFALPKSPSSRIVASDTKPPMAAG